MKTLTLIVGQWRITITLDANELAEFLKGGKEQLPILKYEIVQLRQKKNSDKFFAAFFRLIMDKYGGPFIEVEPDLGFATSDRLEYVNKKGESVKPDQNIGGIICQGGLRGSLTNLTENQTHTIVPAEDGSIVINGETWWVATLFLKDKNRFRGYDAFLVKVKPAKVRVLELGDLELFAA